MRYIVKTWENNSIICPCYRKAKQIKRWAEQETYCAWIKPYHGPFRSGTVFLDGVRYISEPNLFKV